MTKIEEIKMKTNNLAKELIRGIVSEYGCNLALCEQAKKKLPEFAKTLGVGLDLAKDCNWNFGELERNSYCLEAFNRGFYHEIDENLRLVLNSFLTEAQPLFYR